MKSGQARALAIALTVSIVTMASHASAENTVVASARTPEQQADAVLMKRFWNDALQSSNMRLRVMFGTMLDPSDDAPYGRTLTPIDELAALARGSSDPMVLALLVEPCENDRLRPKPTCDALDTAMRWTAVDTQNQVAWLTLSSVWRFQGDLTASREAFARAARASMWHEYFDEGGRVIAAAIPTRLSMRTRVATMQIAATLPAGHLLPNSAVSTLAFHCKDPTLREACLRIIDTIDRDSGSLFSSQVAIMIGKSAGLDPTVLAARTQRLDALRGASMKNLPRDWWEIVEGDELTQALNFIEGRLALGELPSLRKTLAESGVSEAASAGEYRQFVAGIRERAIAESANRPN